jgi:hypothetical protein
MLKVHHPSSLVRAATFTVSLTAALLAACSSATTTAPTSTLVYTQTTTATLTGTATAKVSPTFTKQPTPSPTQTIESSPTDTPIPSLTHTLSPTDTPTLHPSPTLSTPVSHPLASPAQCPQPSGQVPTISAGNGGASIIEIFEPQIRDYLNASGSTVGLQETLSQLTLSDGETTWQARTQVMTIDVTGDTTPDVVMDLSFFEEYQYADGAIFAFICREGQYAGGAVARIGGQVFTSDDPDPGIRAIQDMNGNGVPEIVYSYIEIIGTHANFTRAFRIIEWDGNHFVDLIQSDAYHPNAAKVSNGDGEIRDTDGNGTLELVLTHGAGRGPDASTLDDTSTEIWAWNGFAFTLAAVLDQE